MPHSRTHRPSGLARALVRGAVVLVLAIAAPRGASAQSAPADASPVVRVFDTKTNAWTTFGAMIKRLARADVVFFGEQHNDPDTHAAELAVLAALGDQRERTVLSLEMFERDVQPALDRYLSGAESESVFVASARPWDRYVTDYRGLVELARVRGWPVIAANIPRRVASGVSRRGLGLLDTLSQPERGFAAAQNICPHDQYYTKFAETMKGHGSGAAPGATSVADTAGMGAMTDLFYEAQCVKDEAMAESIANAYSAAGAKTLLLHINGAFHSDDGLGTLERVKRRLPKARIASVTAVPTADLTNIDVSEHVRRADYIIYTKARAGDGEN